MVSKQGWAGLGLVGTPMISVVELKSDSPNYESSRRSPRDVKSAHASQGRTRHWHRPRSFHGLSPRGACSDGRLLVWCFRSVLCATVRDGAGRCLGNDNVVDVSTSPPRLRQDGKKLTSCFWRARSPRYARTTSIAIETWLGCVSRAAGVQSSMSSDCPELYAFSS